MFAICLVLTGGLYSCQDNTNKKGDKPKEEPVEKLVVHFNEDSAYNFIQKQVDFGPRIPGTVAHGLTANYLLDKLKEYCDEAMIQEGEINSVSNKKVPIRNIIGSINPEKQKRILLCAHWDTRPMADEDPDEPTKPADGASDGGSGVGVLLEVARQLSIKKPDVGVDIVLFDAEDMGESEYGVESWCLGSQYWARNPHKPNYTANFGILLDMVGAKDARFMMESHSMIHARSIVEKVWRKARSLGHGDHFLMYEGGMITDDHYFINTIIRIPTIDIIQYDLASGFGEYWHTLDDNMSIIDKNTLEAVGETVLHVVYEE
ncbi:M28 family peptidase [bacterium]|nr:M28 family peptidase [bacterium]